MDAHPQPEEQPIALSKALDHAARMALVRRAAELQRQGDRRGAEDLLAALNAEARNLPVSV